MAGSLFHARYYVYISLKCILRKAILPEINLLNRGYKLSKGHFSQFLVVRIDGEASLLSSGKVSLFHFQSLTQFVTPRIITYITNIFT